MLSEIQIETISRKLNATLLLILPYMFHKIATDSITFFSHSLFTTKFEQKCSWINFQFTKILKFRFQRQIVLECKNGENRICAICKSLQGLCWTRGCDLGSINQFRPRRFLPWFQEKNFVFKNTGESREDFWRLLQNKTDEDENTEWLSTWESCILCCMWLFYVVNEYRYCSNSDELAIYGVPDAQLFEKNINEWQTELSFIINLLRCKKITQQFVPPINCSF